MSKCQVRYRDEQLFVEIDVNTIFMNF